MFLLHVVILSLSFCYYVHVKTDEQTVSLLLPF